MSLKSKSTKMPPVAEGGESQPKPVKKKVKSKAKSVNWGFYIMKVLRQVHPTLRISKQAMTVMVSCVEDTFERISNEANLICRRSGTHSINTRDIQSAVRLVFPGELSRHAVSEGCKAVINFKNSDGARMPDQAVAAEEEAEDDAEISYRAAVVLNISILLRQHTSALHAVSRSKYFTAVGKCLTERWLIPSTPTPAAGGVSSFRSMSHSFSDFLSSLAPGGDCTNVLESRCSPERRRGSERRNGTSYDRAGSGPAGPAGQGPDVGPAHEDVSVVLYPEELSMGQAALSGAPQAPAKAAKSASPASGRGDRPDRLSDRPSDRMAYPWPDDAPLRPASSSPKHQPEETRQTPTSLSPKHARLTSSGNLRKSAAYDTDPEDLLDQHVAYYLRHHKDVAAQHSVNRLCPGVYAIDDREVRVEWQHATEPGGQGFLVAMDGPLRQPFADYMEHSENNAEYDVQGGGLLGSLDRGTLAAACRAQHVAQFHAPTEAAEPKNPSHRSCPQ
ncbi:unnamed protein product [Symbiodinium natans]|uniref:Core Histone H2A/H2B/H3 domain-containing protein n=1 Tax=Symbiodinium natans TaxID=878477 RepID=A0A812IE58_9DINO|nr:unnamed protein product [Symbiodinium natans]